MNTEYDKWIHTWELRGAEDDPMNTEYDKWPHTWDLRGVEVDNVDTRVLNPLHAEESAILCNYIFTVIDFLFTGILSGKFTKYYNIVTKL
jgi:hypothetical protein